MTPSNTNRTPRRRPRSPQAETANGTSQALEFLRLIWAMDHALQVRSKYMARTIRVTGPQRLALRLIENAPGLTASDLTETLHVHKSTLSGVLQRLETSGLISRQTDTEDARRQRLNVTPAGRTLAERRNGTVESTVADVLREFPSRDVDAARRVLQRLADRLGRLPRAAGGA